MLNRKTFFIREHVGFLIALNQDATPAQAMLLLAAGLAVDTVYKEG